MTDRYKSRATTHAACSSTSLCPPAQPVSEYGIFPDCDAAQAEAGPRLLQPLTDEALLRQVLEALEVSTRFVYADLRPQCEDAIAALRNRLGEKEQR